VEILKLGNVFKNWSAANAGVTQADMLIARALLATKDVSSTLFITEASFEEVSRVYCTLEQSNFDNPAIATVQVVKETKASIQEESFTDDDLDESTPKKRLDRKKVVGYVMSNIVKSNKGTKVVKVRYNTMEVQLPNNQKVKVKVGTSRDYHDASNNHQKICCSWHKEDDQQITQYDYHIYVVECGNAYKGLIFKTSELQSHLNKKTYNDHFVNYYFHWNSNGSVTDERDTTIPIDVTKYDADKTQWQLN
jgi:hypothetical protein